MEKKQKNRSNAFRYLIHYFRATEQEVTEEHIDRMWSQLKEQVRKDRTRSKHLALYFRVASVAAALLGIVWLGYHQSHKEIPPIDSFIAHIDTMALPATDEVLLITNNKKPIPINKGSVVAYSKQGTLSVDEKEIEKENNQDEAEEYNQLIVPKGKYTRLLLSDGSSLHVNAGSKVVYPRHFTGDKREIYVDGEIFIDVTRDEKKPFIVKTATFDVEVLGTAFNVNAYRTMKDAEVVLLRGAVAISGTDKSRTNLVPNRLAHMENGKVIACKVVDASSYMAWTQGRLPLNHKDIGSILQKLSIFYGDKITFDPAIQSLPLEGVIDLTVPLNKVLERISKTVPIEYEKTVHGYYLRAKKMLNP